MATGEQELERWYCRGGRWDGEVKARRLATHGRKVGQWYYLLTDEVIIVGGVSCRVYEWAENTVPPPISRARRPPSE